MDVEPLQVGEHPHQDFALVRHQQQVAGKRRFGADVTLRSFSQSARDSSALAVERIDQQDPRRPSGRSAPAAPGPGNGPGKFTPSSQNPARAATSR